MTGWRYIARSLRFYWRTHLGVLLGSALATGILVGALAVGDSVRFTLVQQARARLGKTEVAFISQDRFFRAQLADEISAQLQAEVAPILLTRGSVATPDGGHRVNEVQIVGVENRFWKIGGAQPRDDEVVINRQLATRLGLSSAQNTVLIIRMEEPSYVSRDTPISEPEKSTALRVQVRWVDGENAFGEFSLQSNQVAPCTIFVPIETLQKQLKRVGRANGLLVAGNATVESANAALRKSFQLDDAELELRDLTAFGMSELRTPRVFIDPPVAAAVQKVAPKSSGVLTYFVNEIRSGDHATPYSFVTAADESLRDDEITINAWLADDLAAKIGDEITLRYFVLGEQRQLREESAHFRVAKIAPMEGEAIDPNWAPDFPGLTDAEDCREWKPGIPIDTARIRPRDEDYWKKYRATPKAFVNLRAGQRIWNNRLGDLTALRFPAAANLAPQLAGEIDPAKLGFAFLPVREQALRAARESQDFGQLFIGFSFFLIAAALLLMAMLFVFSLEQRAEETGVLLALGFTPRRVRMLSLGEGIFVAAAGVLPGLAIGVGYAKAALLGLGSVWKSAVGGTHFVFHLQPGSIATGMFAGLISAMIAMWFVARKQAAKPAAVLLGTGAELEMGGRSRWNNVVGIVALMGAGLTFAAGTKQTDAAETFFVGGALLLIAGIAFSKTLLMFLSASNHTARHLMTIGLRNAARRPGRSLATAGILASGIFLVIAVNAFHRDPQRNARDRHSGTGGFALYAQSTLPIYENLNDPGVRDQLGISGALMKDVSIVAMRVRDGDDASCLNLNRALQPRVLGVDPKEFELRGAFQIQPLWEQLGNAGAVDEATLHWSLRKNQHETIRLTDDAGDAFDVALEGVLDSSILQGNLIISESNFTRKFPATAGYRAFLIDAPVEKTEAIGRELSIALRDKGFEAIPASQRLADFQAVENTYLAIFQALGGLGLLLGSAGLGIVVLRNVLERRSEFALMQALGFKKSALQMFVVSENFPLIFLGLLVGVAAAIGAVLPGMRSISFVDVAVTISALALAGIAWTWIAARIALRGSLQMALRNE